MIIPIGHESQKVNRIPWISFIIMAACFVIHIAISSAMNKVEKELQTDLYNLFHYYFEHSYLQFNDEIKELFKLNDRIEEALEQRARLLGAQPEIPEGFILEEEQRELDRFSDKLLATIEKIPFKKYGFVPTKKSLFTLLSYMFLHGGWLHLIGNLLLFYMTGPFIEDTWGKPVFLALYILGGMLAGQMFAVHYPNFAGPLIGASGAVSAVMGAFLVKFWRTKIKFFFWFFIAAGTFRAPAWLMLPLWLVLEFYNAKAMDSLKIPGGGGVAHWAHIWGFVFGAFVALGLKYSGIEEKYITPKIKSKVSFKDEKFTFYEEAMQLIDSGEKNRAFDKLLEGARLHPTNQGIVELLWHLGFELDRKEETASYYLRLIEHELRQQNIELGLFHYGQLKEHFPDITLNDQTKLNLIDFFISKEEYETAGKLTEELAGKVSLSSPAGFLLGLVEAAKRYEFSQIGKETGILPVRKVIELSLQHPDIPDFKKEELKALLNKLPEKAVGSTTKPAVTGAEQGKHKYRAKQTVPGPEEPERKTQAQPREPAARQRTLDVTRVVPIGFEESRILLEIENVGRRVFSLDKVRAISVVRITSQGNKPFFLVDLFVDDPSAAGHDVRTIRMLTPKIALQRFFPNEADRLEAFRKFISRLLSFSGARPYPNIESLQLKKVITFPTVKDYDDSLKSNRL